MDLADPAVDAVRRGDLEFLSVVLANMNREAGLVAAIKLLSVVAGPTTTAARNASGCGA